MIDEIAVCPCRLAVPLDYSRCDPAQALAGLRLLAELGEWTTVTVEGKGRYRVSRHCIMLHGVKGAEIDRYGFEELEEG